jgi:acetyltransferase-like isoleucine patch superfamily enzyme
MRRKRFFVHRLGRCETADVGPRTRIWAFAHVLSGAIIGADCNICDHTFVECGATLGDRVTLKNGVSVWTAVTLHDDVFVGPNAVFTNDHAPRALPFRTSPAAFRPTVVERGATIGANATILCGITIGEHAMVGAGAVVTSSVPAYALMVGVPARRTGWICACGNRLEPPFVCACGRTYRLGSEVDGLEQTTTPEPQIAGDGTSRLTR